MTDEPKRRAQKTFHEPYVYVVGTDITKEQYDELVVKMADWFTKSRKTEEPAADARFRIKCCLEGKTLDGAPWYSHWKSSFATRVKMMCRFDFDNMKPITTGNERNQAKKEKAKKKEIAKRKESIAAYDPHIPELTRAELKGSVSYGSRPLPVTEAEQLLWNEYRDAYLEQFPELRTVNARGELAMLCDLQVVHERNRLRLLSGKAPEAKEMIETSTLITNLKKALGIHPDQLEKKAKEKQGSSVADAVARFEAMPKEVRDKFLAEEFLILYQQYMTPSPRGEGAGYQLDEVGLFGATRCRTCECSGCGRRNYAGFNIEEVEAYLVKKENLVLDPEEPEELEDLAEAAAPAAPDAPEHLTTDDEGAEC